MYFCDTSLKYFEAFALNPDLKTGNFCTREDK